MLGLAFAFGTCVIVTILLMLVSRRRSRALQAGAVLCGGTALGFVSGLLAAVLDYARWFRTPGVQIGDRYFGNSILATVIGAFLGSAGVWLAFRIREGVRASDAR